MAQRRACSRPSFLSVAWSVSAAVLGILAAAGPKLYEYLPARYIISELRLADLYTVNPNWYVLSKRIADGTLSQVDQSVLADRILLLTKQAASADTNTSVRAGDWDQIATMRLAAYVAFLYNDGQLSPGQCKEFAIWLASAELRLPARVRTGEFAEYTIEYKNPFLSGAYTASQFKVIGATVTCANVDGLPLPGVAGESGQAGRFKWDSPGRHTLSLSVTATIRYVCGESVNYVTPLRGKIDLPIVLTGSFEVLPE